MPSEDGGKIRYSIKVMASTLSISSLVCGSLQFVMPLLPYVVIDINLVLLLLRYFCMQGNLILSDIGLQEKRIYHAALNGNNSLPSVLHQKDD
jgi:hypothetical protein